MVESSHMKRAIELLNDADQWPEGLIVRRYFKPKNHGLNRITTVAFRYVLSIVALLKTVYPL